MLSTPDFVGYNHTAPMFVTVCTWHKMCKHFTVCLRNHIRWNVITTEPKAGDVRKAVVLLLYIHNKTGNENCTLMGYYAMSSSNCIPTFRVNPAVQSQNLILYACRQARKVVPKRLRNSPEQCTFCPHRGGSLKSRTRQCTCDVTLRRFRALLLWKSNKHYTSCIVVA